MIESDMMQFSRLMTSISELYKANMSKPLLELYWQTLKSFDYHIIAKALTQHLAHPECGQFMPKPANIINHITGTHEQQALSKMAQARRTISRFESVVFDDPIIHAVVSDMGGWLYYREISTGHLPAYEKAFIVRYKHYCVHEPPYYPNYLKGRIESEQCRIINTVIRPPIIIGEPDKAKQVMQGGNNNKLTFKRLPPRQPKMLLDAHSNKQ